MGVKWLAKPACKHKQHNHTYCIRSWTRSHDKDDNEPRKRGRTKRNTVFSNAETKNAASIDISTSYESAKRKQVQGHDMISRQKSVVFLQTTVISSDVTTHNVDKENQLDVTFCILYFSSNSCSTCFGQPCAHHRELTTAWCYSLVLVCAVAAGRLSSPVGI